jgi:hypothetical protein
MSFMLGNAESFAHIAHAGMLPLAQVLSFVMRGTAAFKKVWPFGVHALVHRVLCKVSILPSVLRQPAHQQAAPKCHAPSPGRLPVLRQSAHHFGGLKGFESSGIVSASLLSGVLPKALKLSALAFNIGSSACKVSSCSPCLFARHVGLTGRSS